MRFTQALVRCPSQSMISGITAANLGLPNIEQAQAQHRVYVSALRGIGLDVLELPSLDACPDAVFVEDVAVITPHCAVIANPGAPSRKPEIVGMAEILGRFRQAVDRIREPGTLEGGDVMMAGSHYFIGLTERTNAEGARQLIAILNRYGLSGSTVSVEHVLHLKTAVCYLEHNRLAVTGELMDHPEFRQFQQVKIDSHEAYAANCVWINNNVLVPAGFPRAAAAIGAAGYDVLEIDVSEFQKLDGGLSCLSIRF